MYTHLVKIYHKGIDKAAEMVSLVWILVKIWSTISIVAAAQPRVIS